MVWFSAPSTAMICFPNLPFELIFVPVGVVTLNSAARDGDELNLSLDGWEGPLDLLLSLARTQKVDLAQISILELVEQYLAYLSEARALKLEIAADYLVMAAWLAYLKSCLLLPKDPEADPSPEEIALRLQMRLQRLDAMREAGARLLGRDRLGRDVFVRGGPEGLRLVRKSAWQVTAFELFAAYGAVKARTQPPMHVVHARAVMTLDEAIERVSRMLGMAIEWTEIEAFLPQTDDPQLRRSALASSFLAALELARRGRLDLQQDEAFAPLRVKAAA
jgi:segregation and condensation protein A